MTGLDPAAAEYARGVAPRLLRLAYGLTGNTPDAEDLVQDALAIVMIKWDKVSAVTNTDAYVRRILVNRFLGLARRRRNTEWVTDTRDERFDVGRPDISDEVCTRDEVLGLLAGLPARQRAVLTLRYLEDLPDEQIAEIVGCRTTSVRALSHRAIGRIRKSLDGQSESGRADQSHPAYSGSVHLSVRLHQAGS